MTKESQEIVKLYEKVDNKGRILICAAIIILTEGTEEEKARLNELMDETKRQGTMDEICGKYYSIIQERLIRGTLI